MNPLLGPRLPETLPGRISTPVELPESLQGH